MVSKRVSERRQVSEDVRGHQFARRLDRDEDARSLALPRRRRLLISSSVVWDIKAGVRTRQNVARGHRRRDV